MAQKTIRTSNRSIRFGLRSDSHRINLRSFTGLIGFKDPVDARR